MITPRAFKSSALFNTVKLLSAYFRIHKAPISLPGTSLALQLSHLNVFNLHRIASYWNDMQNLICCVALPLVFSLSGADGKRTEFMSKRNGKVKVSASFPFNTGFQFEMKYKADHFTWFNFVRIIKMLFVAQNSIVLLENLPICCLCKIYIQMNVCKEKAWPFHDLVLSLILNFNASLAFTWRSFALLLWSVCSYRPSLFIFQVGVSRKKLW